ncbi:hypothetical protein A9Q81_08630 [Gammaproteobacteria bacterium 42_54_T18]|nr:hypothetical protein A9Q81_08630 [Gammaproteobacteria bacterium 42_54_T18]
MSRWEGFEEFVQVVDTGGFSAAARATGASKGHISQQISRLEDRLGARLLNRTTRKISLTDVGEEFYDRCTRIIEELDEAERSVSSLQSEAKGILRISTPSLLGEIHLVPALAEFQKTHPKLEIELNFSSRKVDLIEEGYDLVIQLGKRTDINVVNKPLCRTRFHVAASPDYLEDHGVPKKPSDLKQHNCLMFTHLGQSKPWKFVSAKGKKQESVKGTWRSSSGNALRAAAIQGLGLVYLPDYYIADDIKSGKLQMILSEWSAVERDIVVIYQERRHLSAKTRLCTEHLMKHFESVQSFG